MGNQSEKNSEGSRQVVAMGLVSFFQDVSSEMIYPLLPVFLVTVLRAPATALGLIEGTAETIASLLKVFSGWLSDRSGRRKIWAIAGYGLSGLIKPTVALARGWPWVFVVRLTDRFGKGLRTAPRDALLAASVSESRMGRAFGFHRAMDTLGAVLGPLVAALLLYLYGQGEDAYRLTFAWALLPGLLSLLILIILVREKRGAGKSGQLPKLSLEPFPAAFKRFLFVVVLFMLGNSSDAFVILRAKDLGIAPALVPVAWGLVFNVVYSAVSVPAGMLSDRIGRRRVIVMGYLLYALTYLGLAVAGLEWHAWALLALYGVYYGLTEGVLRAMAADLAPEEVRGTAFGIYHTFTGLALLPASLIAGYLWDNVGHGAPFVVGAATGILAAALLWIWVRNPSEPATR